MLEPHCPDHLTLPRDPDDIREALQCEVGYHPRVELVFAVAV